MKNSVDAYGAQGKTNLLMFDPEALHLVIETDHPLYDERVHDPLDDAMVRNIMALGVIEPVVINKNIETGRVEVVAGRQRVKNAREANKRLYEMGRPPVKVPAIIRKGEGAELASVAVSENELRRSDTAMVRARKMRQLEGMGHDHEAISVAFGVNVKTVENTLVLLDCSKAVQGAVESGLIGITDVKQLSRLTPEQQAEKIQEIAQATGGKEGHARARAKREAIQRDSPKVSALKLKGRREIEAKLKEIAEKGHLFADVLQCAGWRNALEWVIGAAPSEPERDTKTRDLVEELADGASA